MIALVALAAGLSAQNYLLNLEKDLESPFQVRIIGTPAEETTGGKIDLLNKGCFDDVDFALMAHPGPESVLSGNWLALQEIKVEYKGKSAHASAAPWEGINALDAAVSAYTSLSHLRQQTLPTDRIHGIITHGGDAPNIIPERTEMVYYLRSQTLSGLERLKGRALGCFQGAALGTGCQLTVTPQPHFAHVQTDSRLAFAYEKEMTKTHGMVFSGDRNFLPRGSTDFGNVSQKVPSIHPLFCLNLSNETLGYSYHTAQFCEKANTDEAFDVAFKVAQGLAFAGLTCSLESQNK